MSRHIIIEAENLHALVALTYTHAGKIDVIYIDPPYNTGNKDFVYNDSYVDSEDSYRHSKWLSFMEKRLKIAKSLLSEKGVIFISVDDNEQAQLKLMCDEIFGSDKFLGNVIWEKTDSPRMDVKGFTVRHDYILVYSNDEFILKRLSPNEIPEHYNKVDKNGKRYYLKPLRLMGGHKSDSLYYGIQAPDGTIVTNNENGICEDVTYERNKRVIQGYTNSKGEQVPGLTKNNLRYYKADFIAREPSSKNKRELVKAATDLLCIKENLYEEVKMTCNGKTLRKDYARRHPSCLPEGAPPPKGTANRAARVYRNRNPRRVDGGDGTIE